ncbi:hypothetical protein MHM95_09875 [Pseudoalteromonas sp. CnMc7-15]|uniref:hypothetical protein n=1 Tax=unclassified Pseudoalteromonas TaxID=194690 RepID=UPI001EF462E7|nr:hypothetical protein [Pseudoalteromonas sp. CnMc7-15]MCG7566598.1 hypothetical protein [Pseudoalteromonas sp. CnMc7-15]
MLTRLILEKQTEYADLLAEQGQIRKQLIALDKQQLHYQGGKLMSHPKGVATAFSAGSLTELLTSRPSLKWLRLAQLLI